ncbi:alpha/beta-hydrolase [Xylariomycetidae sp. FL2044]|nr:alpha/beta-hydrolase [Xylariomycetidae sp. FL2044]
MIILGIRPIAYLNIPLTMRLMLLFIFALLGAVGAGDRGCSEKRPELTVKTLTGRYTGLQNKQYQGVREFRNIPYAQPPVGQLRWKPPVPLRHSHQHHFSYRFPPSCPQYLTSQLSLWNTNISDFSIYTGDQSHHDGAMAQTTAEDCLSLAIFTPIDTRSQDKLPVGLFLPGGSFRGGGLDAPYHNPSGWVNRSQSHIMVTMNYRTNIYGFPNARGLEDQNLGVLDQRLALEWVYANIGAFGGDQDRITVWGHSAGGVSADVLNFAYYDDPIAAGFFLMSGAAVRHYAHGDDALQTNFTYVAKELGCDFSDDAGAEVECMQQVPISLISNFIGKYGDDDREPSLFFRPTVDDKLIFENYTERAEKGLVSRAPALLTDTSNEQASLITYPSDNLAMGPNKTDVDEGTLDQFICPAYNSSTARNMNALTTYRYQYAGNFSNVSPYWWMGASHGADLPMIFGSYNLTGNATEFERSVAEAMQDYVLAFLEDPENGLRQKGWFPSNSATDGNGPMVRFGAGSTVVRNITSMEVDGACMGQGVYIASPEK